MIWHRIPTYRFFESLSYAEICDNMLKAADKLNRKLEYCTPPKLDLLGQLLRINFSLNSLNFFHFDY